MAYRATLDVGNIAWPRRHPSPRVAGPPGPPPTVAVLRFALPRALEASVLVHDSQGRLMRTLLAGELAAGEHACGWDGRDDQHVPAPTGEYTLRLEVAARLVTARRVSIA